MHLNPKYNKVRISAVAVGIAGILASTVGFAKGAKQESEQCECPEEKVSIVDEGRSLSLEAELRGLRDDCDVEVELIATATVDLVCVDPSGHEAQWAEPDNLEIELTDSKTYSRDRIENGRLDIRLETDSIAGKLAGAPDCPACDHDEWSEAVKAVRFTEFLLVVRQPGKNTLRLLCAFDSPTKNGEISPNDVSCDRL